MPTLTRIRIISIATAAIVLSFAVLQASPTVGAPASAPKFKVTDLGTVPQIAADVLPGLNSAGDIVIWRQNAALSYAPVLITRKGQKPLPLPKGYLNAFAYSLNDRDNAIGWANTTQNPVDSISTTHACLFSHGRAIDIGTLGGRDSRAYAVNNADVIAGVSDLANKSRSGFIYAKGKMTSLPALPSGTSSIAFDINEAGVAVGASDMKTPKDLRPMVHAVLWKNGHARDIGALSSDATSIGYALNNHNDVVGISSGLNIQTVFLYTQGKMHDLDIDGRPSAVNDKLQVVGTREGPERGHSIGFLWQNGQRYDLTDCLVSPIKWGIEAGYRINNSGQIACVGRIQGLVHALLLTPIVGNK